MKQVNTKQAQALISSFGPSKTATLRVQTSSGGRVPYPIESYRWWAALKLYGSPQEKAGLETIMKFEGPMRDTSVVVEDSRSTFEFLRQRFPNPSDRLVARQAIWDEGSRLRDAARSMGGRSQVRGLGEGEAKPILVTLLGAGVGWALGGVPGSVLGGMVGAILGGGVQGSR